MNYFRLIPLASVLILISSISSKAYEFNADFRLVPPDMTYQNEQPYGPIKEIVDLAIKRANHTIIWHSLVPWKRTQVMAKQGRTDILVRHSMNTARNAFLKPILIGYQQREIVFLKAPNKKIKLESFYDLENYTIGEHRGYFYYNTYNESKNLKRTPLNTHEQLFKMLEAGRIDLLIMNKDSKGDLKKALAIPGVKIAKYKVTFLNPRYCSIPLKSPAIKYFNEISNEFFKMRRSGEINQILLRHNALPFIQDFTTAESKAQEALLKK